jgi:hypothetical protein
MLFYTLITLLGLQERMDSNLSVGTMLGVIGRASLAQHGVSAKDGALCGI